MATTSGPLDPYARPVIAAVQRHPGVNRAITTS